MTTEYVTVSRRVEVGGITITDTATAPLADDLSLDDKTESIRRGMLAFALFDALPSAQPTPRVVLFGKPTGNQ